MYTAGSVVVEVEPVPAGHIRLVNRHNAVLALSQAGPDFVYAAVDRRNHKIFIYLAINYTIL